MKLAVFWFIFVWSINNYKGVVKWFRSIDDELETEERDDMYIFSPKSLDLGIKIRKGRNTFIVTVDVPLNVVELFATTGFPVILKSDIVCLCGWVPSVLII